MRFPSTAIALALSMIRVLPAPASAEILDTGDDTERTPAILPVQSVANGACRIAWYRRGGADGEIERLREMGHDVQLVGSGQLTPDNLQNYDALVIAYVEPGPLASRQPAIQAFVDLGGGLLIHQPNDPGTTDYAPVGFQVTIADAVWCTPTGYTATIVHAGHPITAGLTDADLSGAFDDVASIGPGYTVLASSAACGYAALAVGNSGTGRVVFDTGNANVLSLVPGSEAYWDAVFDWLCARGPVAVERATWGRAKAAYRRGS